MTQYIIYGLGGVLLLALVATGVQTFRLHKVEGRLAESQKMELLLRDHIAQRDAVIAEVQKRGEMAEAKAREAQKQAVQVRTAAQERIQRLMAEQVPEGADAQVQYILKKAQELNKEWEE